MKRIEEIVYLPWVVAYQTGISVCICSIRGLTWVQRQGVHRKNWTFSSGIKNRKFILNFCFNLKENCLGYKNNKCQVKCYLGCAGLIMVGVFRGHITSYHWIGGPHDSGNSLIIDVIITWPSEKPSQKNNSVITVIRISDSFKWVMFMQNFELDVTVFNKSKDIFSVLLFSVCCFQ